MIRARSARLRRVVAVRTHAVSCAPSCAAAANLLATAMPCLHHAITGMASELTRRDTRRAQNPPWHSALGSADVDQAVPRQKSSQKSLATPARAGLHGLQAAGWDR